jgi:hypothetical protein
VYHVRDRIVVVQLAHYLADLQGHVGIGRSDTVVLMISRQIAHDRGRAGAFQSYSDKRSNLVKNLKIGSTRG